MARLPTAVMDAYVRDLKARNHRPRQARTLTHDGITDTVSGWAARLGLSYGAMTDRLHNHLDRPDIYPYATLFRARGKHA